MQSRRTYAAAGAVDTGGDEGVACVSVCRHRSLQRHFIYSMSVVPVSVRPILNWAKN